MQVVIGYLMKTFGYSFEKTYDLVRTQRNIICPNIGFVKQLKIFDRLKCNTEGDTDLHLFHLLKYCRNLESMAALWGCVLHHTKPHRTTPHCTALPETGLFGVVRRSAMW